MRTYRKREWSSLVVNMTPLINVIFLITVFMIIMINFSEVLLREVNLPEADEAKEINEQVIKNISITVKSEEFIYLERKRVSLDNLEQSLWQMVSYPQKITVQLRGDKNIPYEVVRKVMQKIAALGITRIEFSARKEAVPPLAKDAGDEDSYQSYKE